MRTTRTRRVGALLVGLTLVAAACGSDSNDDSTDTTAAASDTTTAAAPTTEAMADTTVADTTADTAAGGADTTVADVETKGALAGMKGTTPLVPLSDDFKERLAQTPTGQAGLQDFNYAAETYDAIIVIALAAETAGTDGLEMANAIPGVTRDGEKCTSYAQCVELVRAGTDIDYDGASGPLTMAGNGDPIEGSYGVLTFGEDNRLTEDIRYVSVKGQPEADVPLQEASGSRPGDGVLKFGSILPQTGSLAFLGPPEFAGAELAISEINEAGGALGKDVEYSPGDSGDTSTDIASQTVDRLIQENVDAIIGAASSSVSLTVIDKITSAGIVQFSPANTSNKFTDYADNGLYFRDAPPDTLQGAVVGQLVAEDGAGSAYILALDDAYGTGLADVVESTLQASGVEVVGKKIYDPKASSFDAEVGDIVAADPDAIVLITFDEGSRILRTMVENGIGPNNKLVYGVDGNMGNALGENFDGGK